MSFEELDHTADFLFRCTGKTPDELFSAAASAMFSVMYECHDKEDVKKEINLASDSIDNLLIDFLSEILFISETEDIVFSKAAVNTKNNSLNAILAGEYFDKEKHSGGTEIKGISRSGVNIKKSGDNYQADIIFDV